MISVDTTFDEIQLIPTGPYAAEKLTDFSYSMAAYGIFIFYHFGILEIFALVRKILLYYFFFSAFSTYEQ